MSNDKPKTQRVNFSFDDSSLESLRHLQERQLRDGFVELTITNPETNESRTIIVPRQDIQPTGLDSSLSLEARNQVDYFQVAAALERQLTVAEAERDRLKSRTYPHMCQDEHIQIGHADSEHETCPLCREIARNEALQAEVTQLAGETKRLTSDIDTLLESSTLLAEDTEVEEKRLRDCLATAETDRNHAIASIVAVSFSLADAGFKGETVREQVASVVARVAELRAENTELKQHDQRLQIFCAELCSELGGDSMRRLEDVSGRALIAQERIESLEADLSAAEEEIGKAKAILIGHGYEENELPVMLENLFEIVTEMQSVMLNREADNASLRQQIESLQSTINWVSIQCGNSDLAELRYIRQQLTATFISESIPACPYDKEYDATDAACECWWRGQDYATAIFCQHVTEILDGKDDGAGANTEPWGTVRKRLLGVHQQLETANAILDQHHALALTACTDQDADMYATFSRMIDERDEWVKYMNASSVREHQIIINNIAAEVHVEARAAAKAEIELRAENFALRQQVREIGERVKAKAISLLEYQCEMAEENHAEFGVCNGIQIALNTINSSLDLAACAAKAEGDNYNE